MVRAVPALVILAVLLLVRTGDAHKGITSKFTFNADVYPVFLNRCGRCHIDGGVGPMSLVKYEDAFPWAESLRAELTSAYGDSASDARAGKVDPHDFVKAAHRQISARELDIILAWAVGGTPEGDTAQTPPVPTLTVDWSAGRPDLFAQMPTRYQMSATASEATHEASLPIPIGTPITVARVDVLPGNPAIVRSAVLSLRMPDGSNRVLGTWVPRQVPAAVTLTNPVRVEPGSHILVRLHYKKTWKHEGQPMSDLSLVGLYFAD
jgi:hypothetical protein